jgi:hypothetical protein
MIKIVSIPPIVHGLGLIAYECRKCGYVTSVTGEVLRDGHIREIAENCESDVVSTYRVWLRYALFRRRLSDAEFQASEAALVDFIKVRSNAKPHLTDLM